MPTVQQFSLSHRTDHRERERERERDRETDRQTDRERERETERQTDRQTERDRDPGEWSSMDFNRIRLTQLQLFSATGTRSSHTEIQF